MEKTMIIRTEDGQDIFATAFLPTSQPKAVAVIGSATAVARKYYADFARYLHEAGYAVYTFDYRGIGQSRPRSLRGYEARMHEWGMYDLEAVLKQVRRNHPDKKLVYIGHSIGGQIVNLAPESAHIDRLVIIGSQLTYWKLWPLKSQIWFLFLFGVAMPLLSKLLGYYPGKRLGLTKDLPKGVALEWSKWIFSKDGLYSHFPDQIARQLNVPVLAYSFSDDPIAPRKAVEGLLSRFAQASITWRHLHPPHLGLKAIGHFGFFRKKFREILWPNILDWLEQKEQTLWIKTDKDVFAWPVAG